MIWKLLTLSAACVVVFLLVVGRGEVPKPEQDQRTFTWAIISEMQGLDPHGVTSSDAFRVIECLYEPLLTMDPVTMRPRLAGAESFEVSDDGLVYTFHLRKDAKWSNGDPVTTADYVYGWQRMMLPDYAAEYKSFFSFIEGVDAAWYERQKILDSYIAMAAKNQADGSEGEVDLPDEEDAAAMFDIWQSHFDRHVGIKALDDHTLQVTLVKPCAFFDQLVAFGCYSPVHQKSHWENVSFSAESGRLIFDKTYFADPERMVTNGPYRLERWHLGDRAVLLKNEHFWNKANMKNDRLVQLNITDLGLQIKQYNAGQVDWLPNLQSSSTLVSEMVQQQKRGERDDVYIAFGAGAYFYRFNCRDVVNGKPNPLADPRVRRALSMAVDRQYLVDRVTRQGQPPMVTAVPEGMVKGYDVPVEDGPAFNVAEAQKLLAEAGYPGGNGLEGLTFLYNTGSGHEKLGQAIFKAWEDNLGIKVTMEGKTWGEVLENAKAGNFMILRASWFGDYQDPTTWLDMYRYEDGNNHGKYNSPAYEAKLVEAAKEFDPQKRLDLLSEAESILLKDCPILPLYQYVNVHLRRPNQVHGLNLNPWSYRALDQVNVTKGQTKASE